MFPFRSTAISLQLSSLVPRKVLTEMFGSVHALADGKGSDTAISIVATIAKIFVILNLVI